MFKTKKQKDRVCICPLCKKEKLCSYVGNNQNSAFYACKKCIRTELKKDNWI